MFEKLELSALMQLAAEGKLGEHKAAVVKAYREFDQEGTDAEASAEFLSDVRSELAKIAEAEATHAAVLAAEEADADADEDADAADADDEEEEDADADADADADLSADTDEDADVTPDTETVAAAASPEAGMISVDQVAELFQVFQGMQASAPTQDVESTDEITADIEKTIVDMSGLGQDDVQETLDKAFGGRKISLRSGEFSREQLQADLMTAWTNSNKGVDGTIDYVGTVSDDFSPEFHLGENKEDNFAAITASLAAHADDDDHMTASICCVPNDVIRDLVSYCRVEGLYSLPRVSAPTGGITYALPSHACGLDVQVFEWKEECDPKAEPQPDKPCQEIECGKYESVRVNAFGWCFEFCNSLEKFNPRQLEYYLAEAQCRFEHLVSQRLLSLVLTHPRVSPNVHTCAAKCTGVAADIYEILAVQFYQIRKELCNSGLRLNVVAPEWVDNLVQIDALRRGGDSPFNSLSAIVSALNGTLQLVDHWQCPDEDEACEFPTDLELLVHVPGVFREIDGGDMNFGIVRDSVLNAQNKARIMYERWNGLAHFGPDCSARIVEITGLEPQGTVGPRAELITCE